MEKERQLMEQALLARKNAVVPVSGIHVGAALRTTDGKIYRGCNIETKFPDGICSERVAFINALSDGARDFDAIAIAMHDNETIYPCGRCRQYMHEVMDGRDLTIILPDKNGALKNLLLSDLLPHSYLNQTIKGQEPA